jgi:hypothetical protein
MSNATSSPEVNARRECTAKPASPAKRSFLGWLKKKLGFGKKAKKKELEIYPLF